MKVSRMALCACLLTAVSIGAKALAGTAEVHVLSNAHGRVEVALKGARILSWRDAAGKELLFMPAQPDSKGTEWSHGGIPLCWPWFGRKDGVIHGFIRTKRFSVVHQSADGVLLRYSLAANEEPSFPHAAEIDVEVKLADAVSLALRTRNTGRESFDFTCGIHPYFAVADYGKLSFSGVDEKPFDCVDGMDKAFVRRADGAFSFSDKAANRTLSMSAAGNSHLIVWTPGTVEPSNRNLKPEDMTKFIGFGPACTKAAGPIALKPGESCELLLMGSVK